MSEHRFYRNMMDGPELAGLRQQTRDERLRDERSRGATETERRLQEAEAVVEALCEKYLVNRGDATRVHPV